MENINIKGSADTYFIPSVLFDAKTGKLRIFGESYLEDTKAFYHPLIQWIENYIKEVKGPVFLDFDLSYYNTSSSKSILEILYVLKDYESQGGQVSVNWFYSQEDDDIEEEIEDFEIESGLKINLIQTDER